MYQVHFVISVIMPFEATRIKETSILCRVSNMCTIKQDFPYTSPQSLKDFIMQGEELHRNLFQSWLIMTCVFYGQVNGSKNSLYIWNPEAQYWYNKNPSLFHSIKQPNQFQMFINSILNSNFFPTVSD